MELSRVHRYRGKKSGKKISGIVNGKKCSFRCYKKIPKKCSTPRQICVKCLISVIRKNDKNYASKICKECTN